MLHSYQGYVKASQTPAVQNVFRIDYVTKSVTFADMSQHFFDEVVLLEMSNLLADCGYRGGDEIQRFFLKGDLIRTGWGMAEVEITNDGEFILGAYDPDVEPIKLSHFVKQTRSRGERLEIVGNRFISPITPV